MSILFLNILTLLAPTQSAENLLHSFTVLCENENVLISRDIVMIRTINQDGQLLAEAFAQAHSANTTGWATIISLMRARVDGTISQLADHISDITPNKRSI